MFAIINKANINTYVQGFVWLYKVFPQNIDTLLTADGSVLKMNCFNIQAFLIIQSMSIQF